MHDRIGWGEGRKECKIERKGRVKKEFGDRSEFRIRVSSVNYCRIHLMKLFLIQNTFFI